jgi:hypothetical protein
MQYNPNFVGLFPADAPQLVVVVKLSSPMGDFYGGRTAAPMTKTIVEAALAARDAALDRSRLAPPSPPSPRPTATAVQSGATRPAVAASTRGNVSRPSLVPPDTTAPSVVVDLPPGEGPQRGQRAARPRSVPDVRGMSLRDAVRSLHFAGFRVQLAGGAPSGATGVTEPASGALASAGSLVRLRYHR